MSRRGYQDQLTDGSDVTLTRRLRFTTRDIPGTHCRYRLSESQDQSETGRINKRKIVEEDPLSALQEKAESHTIT